MKEIHGYECEHCGELYSDKVECVGHELQHILKDRFELTEISFVKPNDTPNYNFDNRVGIFPSELIAENKEWSGYAAKYRLVDVGAVESIYPFDE